MRTTKAKVALAVLLLLEGVGVGAGFVWQWRPAERSPAKANKPRVAAVPRPSAVRAPSPEDKAKQEAIERRNRRLEDILCASISTRLKELSFDNNTPLKEALGYISDIFDITFVIDAEAFKAWDPAADIPHIPVRLARVSRTSLRLVLTLLLKQFDAGYEIDNGRVRIMPAQQVKSKPYKQDPELVQYEAKLRKQLAQWIDKGMKFSPNTPLKEALLEISLRADLTILIDEAAFKAADPAVDIPQAPVRLARTDGITVRSLLCRVLDQVGATYAVVDGILLIVPGQTHTSVEEIIGEELLRAEVELAKLAQRHQELLDKGRQALRERRQQVQTEVVVAGFVDNLKHGDPAVRTQAAVALGELGPSAPSAVPALIQALKDEQPAVRSQAAFALDRMGRAAVPAVPALTEALQDKNAVVRGSAAHALGNLGPASGSVAEALSGLLKDRQPGVRLLALRSLERLGRSARAAVPDLIPMLSDAKVREQVVRTLIRIRGRIELDPTDGESKDAVPGLITLLSNPELTVRFGVVNALVSHGADAGPHLAAALRHKDKRTRDQAAEILARLGPDAADAIEELIDLLKANGEHIDPTQAAATLGSIGPAAIPALVEVLKDKDPRLRARAALALGHIGSVGQDALPALSAALKDPETEVRRGVVEALWQIGPDAEAAVPALLEALKDPDATIRERSIEALGKTRPRGIPVLTTALKDKDWRVRRGAAEGLAGIGRPARRALAALEELRKDEHPEVRAAADKAVRSIREE